MPSNRLLFAVSEDIKQVTGRLPPAVDTLWKLVCVVAVTVGALALWMAEPLVVDQLRLAQFDQFARWQPRPYTPVAVRIVDIDEESLKAVGQWPWPRTRVADLVDRLADAGVLVVAFDVLLSEPDRTAPAAMAKVWRNPEFNAL